MRRLDATPTTGKGSSDAIRGGPWAASLRLAAEAHGFHTLWFAENPFGRAVLPAVAACAADTSRVRLGLGILNPYQHHPTLIAQQAAVLDEFSGGRVRLGIGSGIAQRIARRGTRYRPLAALTDAVQIVRGLLRTRP